MDLIQRENDGEHIDFILPGYAGRPIVGYQSMREDIILCVESAKRFLDYINDETMSLCILHTIVVLYGKCFTNSQKYPRLDPNVCFTLENQSFRVLHEEIMKLRHNLSAHRGITDYDMGFPYLKLNINDMSRQVKVCQLKRNRPKAHRIEQYIALFEFLIQYIEGRFKEAGEKTWDHMLKNYTAEQLAFLKIAGPIISGDKTTGG